MQEESSRSEAPVTFERPRIPPKQLFFKRSEVAEILGISYRAVANWVEDGTLKCSRLGRLYMIPRSEVERLVDQLCTEYRP